MKDHYLSQFYLKGFTDPAARRDLWLYPFDDPSWRIKRPKEIAWEEDYYGEVDSALRIVENTSAPVLRKVRRFERITEDDRVALCTFVMTIMGRVPTLIEPLREEVRSRSDAFLRDRYQRCRVDPKEFNRVLEEMRVAGFTPDRITVDDLDPDKIVLNVSSPEVALVTLRAATERLPVLMAMRWTFVVSRGRDFFITSDHPFYAIDVTAPVRGMYGFAALGDPRVTATLPLGRHVALYLWKGEPPGLVEYRPVDSEAVAELNFRTAWPAAKFIAAPSPIFPGSNDVCKRIVLGRDSFRPSDAN